MFHVPFFTASRRRADVPARREHTAGARSHGACWGLALNPRVVATQSGRFAARLRHSETAGFGIATSP
jgi:hypothetical protein